MAQTNTKSRARSGRTHEGARAMSERPIAGLERVLNAHMLWEDGFYLDGKTNAAVLEDAVKTAMSKDPLNTRMAILRARKVQNIRHASLMAAVVYAQNKGPDARDLIGEVIVRADELAEVLAMAGTRKAPHAVVKGVRDAFGKFDEYQFSKYKGIGKSVTLRDAVFLTHPDPDKVPLVQKIVDETLAVPNTWETRLSAKVETQKEVFTDLLGANKLGAMALLRNLRNMEQAGVPHVLIADALRKANWSKVLPFRFLTAAITAPGFSRELDMAFKDAVAGTDPLPGTTAVMVDTSGSMQATVSHKSIVRAYQAGAALAAAINGDRVDLYQWATITKAIPNWNSLSTALSIGTGAVGHGTEPVQALNYANKRKHYDRIILISDMQFAEGNSARGNNIPALKPKQVGYTINLSAYGTPGLMAGNWTHFTGFSAATLKYIAQAERDA